MKSSTIVASPTSDRVKLAQSFDAVRLQHEVADLQLRPFTEYSVIPLTSPVPKPDVRVADYADGSWADWPETSLLADCPYLRTVVETFRHHTSVTLVRLLRLAPGGHIAEHTDPTLGLEQERSVIRLTIPITDNRDAQLLLNDEPVPMLPGECWYLRFTDPHWVSNSGTSDRINMSIDMIPNRWVRAQIAHL